MEQSWSRCRGRDLGQILISSLTRGDFLLVISPGDSASSFVKRCAGR